MRLELLQDSSADIGRRVELYRRALAGEISGRQVWQQDQLDSRLGVTRGTLAERRSRQASGTAIDLLNAP